MSQKNIKPIDALRRDKQILRAECSASEEKLAGHWHYINNNIGSLVLSGAINGIKSKLGFGSSSSNAIKEGEGGANGLFQGILGGALVASPMIWEMLQPMVMGFVMKKIKSIFTRKKKKKKIKSKSGGEN